MKKLIVLAVLFTSCTTNRYDVKLTNGSVVNVVDYKDRDYSKGDTVCVVKQSSDWHIDEYGNMKDTIIIGTYYDSSVYVLEYKIGIIK